MPAASILDARIRQRLGNHGVLIHYTQRYSDQRVIVIQAKENGDPKDLTSNSIKLTASPDIYPSINVNTDGVPSAIGSNIVPQLPLNEFKIVREVGNQGRFQLLMPARWWENPNPASNNLPLAIVWITIQEANKEASTLPVMVTMYRGSSAEIEELTLPLDGLLQINEEWNIDIPSTAPVPVDRTDVHLQSVTILDADAGLVSFNLNNRTGIEFDFSPLQKAATGGTNLPDTPADGETYSLQSRRASGAPNPTPHWSSNGLPPPDGSITTDKLADQAVTEPKIGFGSIIGRHLKGMIIAAGHIVDAALENRHYSRNSVDGRVIDENTIEQGNMGANSVGTQELIDGNVTKSKLSTALQNAIDSITAAFVPSKANLYAAVKEIFHPSTNEGVTADDTNNELDVSGGGGGTSFSPSKSNLYDAVKEIFHPATNNGVNADDGNNELDIPGVSTQTRTDIATAGRLAGEAKIEAGEARTIATAAMLDADTVIQIGPAFVVGETAQRNLYVSVTHPVNAYQDANIISVSVQGQTPNLQAYDPGEIQAEYTVGLTDTEMNNISSQGHFTEGNYILVDVRFTQGRGGTVHFARNVYVPVIADAGYQTADDVEKALAPKVQTLTSAAVVVADFDDGEQASLTLGHNVGLNITNGVDGDIFLLRAIQDTTAGRTLSLHSSILRGAREAPVLSDGAGELDLLAFIKIGNAWHYTGIVNND